MMIKLKDLLNEDRKSDLEDIFHPHRYWKDFRGTLRKGIDNKLKMEATIGSNTAHFPFFTTTMGVSTRTVQPRSHGIVDPKLLSKTRIMISVLTEDKHQKVIEGDKIKLSTKGLMSIVMEVEKSHGDDVFYIRDSQLKWFHPFKNTMFSMDLGLGTAEGFDGKLVDYIEKEIKFAVKKRGNRIRGARFRVV